MTIRNCILLILLLCPGLANALQPGDMAPAFERVPLHGGQPIALKHYRGKVVMVDFWASWCAPCRKSMPYFNELRARYRKQGFEILAVNLDGRIEQALRFLRDYPVDYPVVHDSGTLPERYGLQVMPTSYIIDRQGRVHDIHYGYKDSDKAEIQRVIERALEEKTHAENRT